jgi:hypothetical protein
MKENTNNDDSLTCLHGYLEILENPQINFKHIQMEIDVDYSPNSKIVPSVMPTETRKHKNANM